MTVSKSTITIPEATYEALIDLKNATRGTLHIESERRRAATLGRQDVADNANAELYDSLTRLQAEYETAATATASLDYDDIIDAEVVDA